MQNSALAQKKMGDLIKNLKKNSTVKTVDFNSEKKSSCESQRSSPESQRQFSNRTIKQREKSSSSPMSEGARGREREMEMEMEFEKKWKNGKKEKER